MAPLAGNRIGADEDPAAGNDAAAAPGPEDDPEHNAAARGRAVRRLGQGKTVGVVREAHRPAERRLDIPPERPPVQPY